MYRTHYRPVEYFVQRHFPTVDEADVISHTFETAWRRFEDIPLTATRGWLIGVARNWSRNAARSEQRRAKYTADFAANRERWHSELHEHEVPASTLGALRIAFLSLRPSDQEVIELASWNGLVGPDLAAALETSPGTAAVRLFRARQRLQEAFNRNGGEL